MAKNWYVGASSVAHKVKKAYVGVGGVAHKVKKAYIGDANGKARLCWSGDDTLYAYRESNNNKIHLCKPDGTEIASVAVDSTADYNSYMSMIRYDKEQNNWVMTHKNSNGDHIGYWNGTSSSAITMRRIYYSLNSNFLVHDGYIYFCDNGNTESPIRKMNYKTGEVTAVTATASIYNIKGFITKDYSTFYVMGIQGTGYVNASAYTALRSVSPSINTYSKARIYGNKLFLVGCSGSSNLYALVFDVDSKTTVRRNLTVSNADLRNCFTLGGGFDRMYFVRAGSSSYSGNVCYTTFPNSDGTLTYTDVSPALSMGSSGEYAYISGNSEFAIGRIGDTYKLYKSSNGTAWNQIHSGVNVLAAGINTAV